VRSLKVDAAVGLFIERGHSVAPGFAADDADAVREICRRLDGIPLAIELAASRISSMTLGDVRDRLDRRFKLLVGSRRSLERHQTLRHAVQWSYDLLDDAEKALPERCSVFAGGFEIQSACAVAGSDDPDDFAVMDLLHSLVRKSLLVVDRSTSRTRFSMLETIRQFAEKRLAASGSAGEARDAHARHFAGREVEIMAVWDSPRQREAYERFTVGLANLRTAFRRAAEQLDLIDGADITPNPWALSFALLAYGMACCDADPVRAREALHRGLVIAQGSGNRFCESHLANVPGRLEARHGDPLAALDYLTLAIGNYHGSGNTSVIHVPLAALAALFDRREHYEAAAKIAGFALNSLTAAWIPEINTAIAHLRDVLGDQTYESLARKGETMTTAEMVVCAYDQIDQARTELNAVS
jgi:hypothetical protein